MINFTLSIPKDAPVEVIFWVDMLEDDDRRRLGLVIWASRVIPAGKPLAENTAVELGGKKHWLDYIAVERR